MTDAVRIAILEAATAHLLAERDEARAEVAACHRGLDAQAAGLARASAELSEAHAEAAALRQALISMRKDVHFAHATIDSENKWDALCQDILRVIDDVTPNNTHGASLLARIGELTDAALALVTSMSRPLGYTDDVTLVDTARLRELERCVSSPPTQKERTQI